MGNFKRILVVLLMCCPGHAVADNSLEEIKKAVDQGDATAQVNLGMMYGKGYGVTQDYKEAEVWYRKAADQGFKIAGKSLHRLCKKSPSACR